MEQETRNDGSEEEMMGAERRGSGEEDTSAGVSVLEGSRAKILGGGMEFSSQVIELSSSGYLCIT